METDEFIENLRHDGTLLATAAEQAGLDAPVPPCPDWQVRDLVQHTGTVHRWATGFIVEGRMEPAPIEGKVPDDGSLLDWYRESHARLVDALTAAPADLRCWHFFSAPSSLEFWARRQAHETAVHRVDAETALGRAPSPVTAAFATDGVDELLAGFHTRSRSRVRSELPRTLRVQALDAPDGTADWQVHISREAPRVERAARGDADCTVRGSAADLYLALWNRGPYDRLEVSGDAELVELWKRASPIV
ncbi:maleylpyruvate isomerase family mycothiol-dependent enzyme [Streptomyces sp. H10-C2]|uniref:maleylpyruvate isomerase family mycothiol-dependent enzyme n=1 Tax=unclassified Streptomyces TaxID=2593676 RepID=UPI0024BBEB0E|nr:MULTISPECIES: maleylpyruvate isomerase family mycothiol-dependent enzyme [unclassified Streptomyces]MDJ0342901.1 maleylpyruvate isomerase family mycothiol-dependent enzyme [Streptomyces sp. PH10-H1]MDJ0372674.1 maleylpyruvate isomerase family mycothiol-dependent enzyme [Streptomyces sp. H10-C2]